MNAMPETAPESVVEVRDLHKRFGAQEVHKGINLTVERGEFLSIIGTSGSGKSTLLHQMIGLIPPDSGTIRILGAPINELKPAEARRLRQHWGVLFQKGALFSAFNVFENIAFPMRELHKNGWSIDSEVVAQSVAVKLHMVGLKPEDAWKMPSELSGGMTKRVALARALMLEAELLFLDEPTTGLDPASATEFDHVLGALHRDLGMTVVQVTHDLYSMAALSDRVAVLDGGKFVTVGTLHEVAAFDHPFIRDFFGSRRDEDPLRDLPGFPTAEDA